MVRCISRLRGYLDIFGWGSLRCVRASRSGGANAVRLTAPCEMSSVEGYGSINWWGFSPATDLLELAPPSKDRAARGEDKTAGGEK